MNRDFIAIDDFDHDIEGRRRLALENRFLGAATSRFFVRQGNRLDAADQVGEGRVHHQVFEFVAVCGADELHASLSDRARRARFELGTDFVDHDDLRHVIFDRFDHDCVLRERRRHLHAPGSSDRGMRNVAIAGDFVAGIDDDHAFAHLIGQHAGAFPQHRRFADARSSEQQDALTGFDQIFDDRDCAEDGTADAASEPDDISGTISDGRDAMKRALDSGPVIVAELADPFGHPREVIAGHIRFGDFDLAVVETRFRRSPEIHHDLDQGAVLGIRLQRRHALRDGGRQHGEQIRYVVRQFRFVVLPFLESGFDDRYVSQAFYPQIDGNVFSQIDRAWLGIALTVVITLPSARKDRMAHVSVSEAAPAPLRFALPVRARARWRERRCISPKAPVPQWDGIHDP